MGWFTKKNKGGAQSEDDRAVDELAAMLEGNTRESTGGLSGRRIEAESALADAQAAAAARRERKKPEQQMPSARR